MASEFDPKKRWSALQNERSSWMTHWSEISENLLPRSGRFFITDRNDGGRRHNKIYDSTGTRALRVLAAGMMSGMTSPARPWFRLSIPDTDMADSHAVKLWLSDVTTTMQNVFARSNTYRALHSMYEELGAFGTAASFVSPSFDKVVMHHPLTVGEYAIATDYNGQVVTLYREFQKTVGEVVREFGYKNCTISTQNAYNNGNLDQWITILHAIEPRYDRDTTKRDAINKPFKSCYYEQGASKGKFLRESGFDRFPAVCPRWSISGGDIYGNSPGMEALGDIKQLQLEQLRKSQAIDFKSNPPVQVPSALKNHDIDLLPGGVSYYDSTGPNAGIRTAFEVNLDLSHLLEDVRDVRERINGAFYADLFLMLANGTNTTMTATEVAERHEEKLLMLGPVLERLHNELLDPLIEMTFDRMVAANMVPPPPEEMQGMDLNIEFVSMLAQAQRAIGTNSIDRYIGTIGNVATMKPDVLDKIDTDKLADIYADMLGIDPTMIVPGDQVALIRQQRAQAQQAASASALANQDADTANKLAGAQMGTDNALDSVVDMFSGYR